MINKITVTNYRDESIELDLRRPELSGFLVRGITGLGPGKADINTSELSTIDGAFYNSARLKSRNIVLDLVLMFLPRVETMRQLSYRYFPIKKRLKLTIETENRTSIIYGYVESNEPNIFDKETTQISRMCPDPYFYSEDITTTLFSGVEGSFEFPFSNESLINPLLEMGDMILSQAQNISYEGDSEIGITIFIHALGECTNLTIYNTGTEESMVIDTDKLIALTGDPIIAGDDIVITTNKGSKSIILTRDGTSISILNCLGKNINWLSLTNGDNELMFFADTGVTNLQFRIENQTMYEGV